MTSRPASLVPGITIWLHKVCFVLHYLKISVYMFPGEVTGNILNIKGSQRESHEVF